MHLHMNVLMFMKINCFVDSSSYLFSNCSTFPQISNGLALMVLVVCEVEENTVQPSPQRSNGLALIVLVVCEVEENTVQSSPQRSNGLALIVLVVCELEKRKLFMSNVYMMVSVPLGETSMYELWVSNCNT